MIKMNNESAKITAGAALFTRLKTLGVDYVFANSGTDFPPIIEGLAEAEQKGIELPEAIVIPFEGAATAMAHGYFLATGKAQAVMVHTNVGLANSAIGAINAATENVPMILMSGRTPTVEADRFGARTVPIGWGQEMRDQTALVREASKWDYELRFPEQIYDVTDRAYAIATSTPKGPVYVSLPREILCETISTAKGEQRPQMQSSISAPLPHDIKQAAKLLAEAKNPVIFAQRGVGNAEAFAALSKMALDWGIPVCQYWAVQLALSSDHPMAADPAPKALLAKADVILVIDSLAPWSPDTENPLPECQVIQLGSDPLHSRVPVRNFRADLCLPGDVASSVIELEQAMMKLLPSYKSRNSKRRDVVSKTNHADKQQRSKMAEQGRNGLKLNKPWVSAALSAAIKDKDATVFSELGCQMPFMNLTDFQAWYQEPHSGGLGWGFPAALGFKLAKPQKTVIATMGDGSYIFTNPVACHQIAEALNLSIILIVLNNHQWGAVRQSVLDIYPDGYASKANKVPLIDLSPSPDFVQVAQASRAWARHVTNPEEFELAIKDALRHTDQNKGLALIEVEIG